MPVDDGRTEPGIEDAAREGTGSEAAYQHAEDGSDYGTAPQVDPRVTDSFVSHMEQFGAEPATINAALAWLQSPGRNASLEGQQVEHPFDFRSITGLSPEDRQHLDSFGNAMARAGASQEDVSRAVDWYMELKVRVGQHQIANAGEAARIAREIEAQDLVDRDRTRDEMRAEWGTEYEFNVRAINRYLGSMSASQRDKIENATQSDGSLSLNNAGRLQELLEKARNSVDRLPGGQMTRDEIEQVMRTDRSRYNADIGMQDRYREMLRDGDGEGKPLPSSMRSVNSEIGRIEQLMRTDRKAYFAQESRYRELLQLRDGN